MMHRIIVGLLLLLFLGHAPAARAQRYLTPVFDSVTIAYGIQFGSNQSYKGDTQQLYLDMYLPFGDTALQRPLVVLAHGGSFLTGSRQASDISTLCRRLAQRGVVAASIDYRMGADILSGRTLSQENAFAVWRATQDLHAAIRFFRKQMATGNPNKLNPNYVYTGGISAGAVMGLNVAFFDRPQEVAETLIDTILLGGIAGNSGNPGYSSNVNGVINLCGAIEKTKWMSNNTGISICSMHGNWDATVPYQTDYYKFLGNNVMLVQGSFSIDSAAHAMGMDSRFYTFDKAGHVPFTGTTPAQQAYMDTTVDYVSRYLYRHITGKIPSGVSEVKSLATILYPNPTSGTLILGNLPRHETRITLLNLQGCVVLQQITETSEAVLHLEGMTPGLYLLQMEGKDFQSVERIVIQ